MIFLKNKLPLIKQIARFGGVGLSALFTHWGVALILMRQGYAPLTANTLAFFIAFQLSYWGHRLWTFQESGVSSSKAFFRFLAIALLGFVLNQALFSALLFLTPLPPSIALLFVLGLVALNNFLLSKFWAFRGPR